MKKWSTGKKLGLIFGCLGAAVILAVALFISIFQLLTKISKIEHAAEYESGDQSEYDDRDFGDDSEYKDSEKDDFNYDEKDSEEGGSFKAYDGDENYYEFQDCIRDDLSYQVKFDTFKKTCTAQGEAVIDITYPIVTGENVPNLDSVNTVIAAENQVVYDYVQKQAENISEGNRYEFTGESYVTYMDERILSIAYVEYGYLNDEIAESYIVSVNIDMETGLPVSNNQILNIDDDFSVEFRKRCEEQNGAMDAISMMSDQEITKYLNNSDALIIFYTPLGMEVGFNFQGGWATVTYKDYLDYQKQL